MTLMRVAQVFGAGSAGRAILAFALAGLAAVALLPARSALAAAPSADWTTTPWPCPSGLPATVTCGRLELPIDWSDPASPRSVSLAYAVHRAPAERIGTITFNPGGPGTSGIDALGVSLGTGPPAWTWPSQILDRFDIVAWDPRGVGYSGPTMQNCERATVEMGPIPAVGVIGWEQVARGYAKRLSAELRACLDANPVAARHLGTAEVIDDLEALRQALSIDQWTYLGTSYGTTIGMAYARAHPERIRALVLDGLAPPSESILQAARSQVPGWRAALNAFGREFPRAGALAQPVMDRLDEDVLALQGAPFGRFPVPDAHSSLYLMMSSLLQNEARFPGLRDLLIELGEQLPQEPLEDQPADQSTIELAVNPIVSLVICADRADHPTIAQAADLAEAAERKGITVAAIPSLQRALWCPGLGNLGRPLNSSTAPLDLPAAALILNAAGDLKTPMVRAKVAAAQIPGSRLITYLGTTHGLFPRAGSACINDAVVDYLLNLRLPATDLTCPIPSR